MGDVIDFLDMAHEEEDEQFSLPCPKCSSSKLTIKIDVLLDDTIPQKLTTTCAQCQRAFEVKIDNYYMHQAFHREGEENDSASESEDGGCVEGSDDEA